MKLFEAIKLYKDNKAAKTGSVITCPVCGKEFVKKQYAQAFCCGKCKDKYHNSLHPDRHKDPDYYNDYNYEHPERMDRLYNFIERTSGPMDDFCDDDSDSFGCICDNDFDY